MGQGNALFDDDDEIRLFFEANADALWKEGQDGEAKEGDDIERLWRWAKRHRVKKDIQNGIVFYMRRKTVLCFSLEPDRISKEQIEWGRRELDKLKRRNIMQGARDTEEPFSYPLYIPGDFHKKDLKWMYLPLYRKIDRLVLDSEEQEETYAEGSVCFFWDRVQFVREVFLLIDTVFSVFDGTAGGRSVSELFDAVREAGAIQGAILDAAKGKC
ncbi:MAG: uncharacterized protein A8A55_1311 [Amphiamblys sp. WSBS2006]|nr:MAG: uncharacterized protein A8A55_1311 [Amphiamblys sp. WSBS2006]